MGFSRSGHIYWNCTLRVGPEYVDECCKCACKNGCAVAGMCYQHKDTPTQFAYELGRCEREVLGDIIPQFRAEVFCPSHLYFNKFYLSINRLSCYHSLWNMNNKHSLSFPVDLNKRLCLFFSFFLIQHLFMHVYFVECHYK